MSRLVWWLPFFLLAGCVGRIIPPQDIEQPVTFYLLDHGRHASLVLPGGQGGMVRYSFGEWRWYVDGRRNLLSGAVALLWPTRAGLGRGVFPEISDSEQFERLAPEGLERIHTLRADMRRVQALRLRLDARFEAPETEPVESEEFGLAFVPDSRRYSAVYQSNLVVANWLRQLGFEVRGTPWLSHWRIVPQAPAN
ncbi:hypothetical protein F0A17_04970 [Billgrantia pellis]|uniref:DUF2459 domain-containing protein n=1 Tax=Billgrantia pellis TaxID=2606936 RepID=A0A7V7G290_9GAMM|nr:hypothetical protein [Halomonas pellis]KAA0013711.1 hypothetical protein F0A17_04970 [Halomonas pellis]